MHQSLKDLGSLSVCTMFRPIRHQPSPACRVAARRAGRPPQLARPALRLCTRSRGLRSFKAFKCHASQDATVHFTVKREVNFGESIKLVGDIPGLGDWNVDRAPQLTWTDGHVWTLDLAFPAGSAIGWKAVRTSEHGAEWEEGPDRLLQIPENGTGQVVVSWEWGGDMHIVETGEERMLDPGSSQAVPAEEASKQAAGRHDDGRLVRDQWQGRDIQFMRSNEHRHVRSGIWNKEGLEGVALEIVSGEEKAGSWLGKIEVVKKLLVSDGPGWRPSLDAMACCYIYLQWISTGAIECVEGGGHYRPNKHAEAAREIFRSLEWVISGKTSTPLDTLVARRMQPKLPSFTEAYTASTPLTRIRDIAHRNDIPHELKQEIKHTIQNKLHRNAGPEDLVAVERMLDRLQAEGGYSEVFLSEFRLFRQELRDFFNASSFKDILEALRPAFDDPDAQVIDAFLEAKDRVDGSSEVTMNNLMDALHTLTTLRALLCSGLSSGLRNDASNNALAMRQRWRLGEIRAEDYAFVLLSTFLNLLEDKGGAETLVLGKDGEWALPIGASVLAVRHIGLSGWQPAECMALENELTAWQHQGNFRELVQALRLKATLERVQRLTQSYVDGVLGTYAGRAAVLGAALGIGNERIQVFAEAEIRASAVFQLSKLSTLLLKAARQLAGGTGWEALVAGAAVGRLVEVDAIEPGVVGGDEDVILLVRRASGDEETGAIGPCLKGVLLAQDLPHLSHLGVRARQEKVVFCTCEDETLVNDSVRPLVGSIVQLRVSGGAVSIEAYDAANNDVGAADAAVPASNGRGTGSPLRVQPAAIKRVTEPTLVQLADATSQTCGAKAEACAQLVQVAQKSAGIFVAPAGVCIPFGSMEAAILGQGLQSNFEDLIEKVEGAGLDAVESLCTQLQRLVSSVRPPDVLLIRAAAKLGEKTTVVCRSSANVEDLAGLSGAGLYDSILNVSVGNAEELGAAVAKVWASLYTRRGVLSRRAAGVPQREAVMAVLVQEMVAPDLSFVLHTASPLDHDPNILYAEIAPGLGETLASGTRGSAWRISVDKAKGDVTTHAFANFSEAIVARSRCSASSSRDGTAMDAPPSLARHTLVVDYSKQQLSVDKESRKQVGRRLSEVGTILEETFGGPQDVEGALAGSSHVSDAKLYIVQTRPQP